MFHAGAVIVKGGLVQFPSDWVGPSSNRAGGIDVVVVEPIVDEVDDFVVPLDFPEAVLVVVEVPAVGAEVVVELPPGATVVGVEPPPGATVVLVEPPPAGGSVYAPPPDVPDEPDPDASTVR
jgi:hypothetical protein